MTRSDAFGGLSGRSPRRIREREVLRVAATVKTNNSEASIDQLRREVLAWVQNRSGGRLPAEAWKGEGFEYMPGGRVTMGAHFEDGGAKLWAVRNDDPDKMVPGRTWTTEIALGLHLENRLSFSLRSVLSSYEEVLNIEPAAPGILRQLSSNFDFLDGDVEILDIPRHINSDEDFENFISIISSDRRTLPVIVASGDERGSDANAPLINVVELSKVTVGLAHIVAIPAKYTFYFSGHFGKIRSVFHGGVRIYMPGFTDGSDPFDHRLILGETVHSDARRVVSELRWLVATESVRRTRLGHDVLPFAAVRSVALKIELEREVAAGASEAERLAASDRRIGALEAELQAVTAQSDQHYEVAAQEEHRAKIAESQLHRARERVRQLETLLASAGQNSNAEPRLPETWESFEEWCDSILIGRVSLAPLARSGLKKAQFADVQLAGRALNWVSEIFRDRKMNGGGAVSNIPIGFGLENAPCGSDAFRFEYHGRHLEAEWHVKSGGNTRDPTRCLRIYYAWDESAQEVVIADMPAHRRTGAT